MNIQVNTEEKIIYIGGEYTISQIVDHLKLIDKDGWEDWKINPIVKGSFEVRHCIPNRYKTLSELFDPYGFFR